MSESAINEAAYPRLRLIDPRILKANPHNPRTTPATPAQDDQLRASIKARGVIQFPVVAEKNGDLFIRAGHRRVKAQIDLDAATIVVIETEPGNIDLMDALAENVVRAAMNSVDTWRAIQGLEEQGWSEPAIADALALPVRTIRRLKLLAHIHPPVLDVMARGDMPDEERLRIIACAALEEQAHVWKKHKPRRNEQTNWWSIANALTKRRIPFSFAKFDEELGAKYGVVWDDDLFTPAGEDGRYTTNVDGFFGAQQEWLERTLPKGGVLVPQNEFGQPQLPKKAEHIHGKPAKGDITGYYLDPRTAEVKTVVYRLPSEKKAQKGSGKDSTAPDAVPGKSRPDVTQKGNAIIGDLRTDALHEALGAHDIADTTLIALLVLAIGGRNVRVQSGINEGRFELEACCTTLIEGGVVTADHALIRDAARKMLSATLSCRENMSNSGAAARIAGETIGAALRLPSMATDEFLSCLSRQALEREARGSGVRIESRVKDTRARMIAHFAGSTWHYPGALFKLSPTEAEEIDPFDPEGETSSPEDDPERTTAGDPEGDGDDPDHPALADAAD